MKSLFLGILLTSAVLLAGCALRSLKPGFGWIAKPDGSVIGVQQSENPKSDSTIKSGETEIRIGAGQKDTAREAAAKLASLRPVMYVGIVVFLFGAASAFWPPLRLVVGSITTSAVIAAAGLVMIILPTFLVGNELLILAVATGGAALYWFSHRHGKIRGELESAKR